MRQLVHGHCNRNTAFAVFLFMFGFCGFERVLPLRFDYILALVGNLC